MKAFTGGDLAAVKIQARLRGKKTRDDPVVKAANLGNVAAKATAAAKIQAALRGKKARKDPWRSTAPKMRRASVAISVTASAAELAAQSRALQAAKAKRQQEKRAEAERPGDDIYCNCCGNDLATDHKTFRARSPKACLCVVIGCLVIALPFVLHTYYTAWMVDLPPSPPPSPPPMHPVGGGSWSGFGVVEPEVASALGFGASVGVRPRVALTMSGGGHRAMTTAMGIGRALASVDGA
jgi:hypothetical protein